MSVSTGTDDPEVARLVVAMAVMQTPAPQHVGGRPSQQTRRYVLD
jgi:hypothetical protein